MEHAGSYKPVQRLLALGLSGALAVGMAPFAFAGTAQADEGLAAASIAAQAEGDAWDWITRTGAGGTSTGESTQNALSYVDSVNDVLAGDDGSLVAVGNYDWKGLDGIPEGHGGSDGLIVKYNSDHSEAWRASVGGTGDDYFSSVAQLADGSYVAVGFAKSLDGDMADVAKHEKKTAYDGIIAKFDESAASDGAVVPSEISAFGGTANDYFQDVVATDDGGFVAVGRAASKDGDLDGKVGEDATSSARAVIVKYNANLELQWSTVIDASSSGYDELYSVAEDEQGNFIASGYFAAPEDDLADSAKGGKDGALVKFDKDGTVLWTKVYGSTGNDELSSVALDCNAKGGVAGAQGYVVAGYASALDGDLEGAASEGFAMPEKGAPWTMRVDADGNVVASRVVEAGAVDATASIAAYEDGYVLAGSFKGESAVLGEADSKGDVYVAGLRSDLSVMEAQTFGGTDKDVLKGMAVAEDGTAYLSGRYLSDEFCGLSRLGKKADGYIMQLDADALASEPDEQFTVPVSVIKAGQANEEANKSMAAGCVYETAFAKRYGDVYEVTLYLQDMTIFGQTVKAADMAAVKYDSDGDGKSDALAARDVYDADRHCRVVVIPVSDLNGKATVLLQMNDADLYFDLDEQVAVDEEPAFFASDAETVEAFADLIEAAKANPTEQNVAAARAAYEALTDDQKKLVDDEMIAALDEADAKAQAAAEKAREEAAAEKARKEAAAEANLANATVKVAKTSYAYAGKALAPAVTVTSKSGAKLKAGTDFTVSYANNVKVGTATVTVKGKGSYTGSKSATFKIAKASQAIKAKAKVTKKLKAKKKTGKLAKNATLNLKKVAKVSAKTAVKFKKANKKGGKYITVAKSGKLVAKKGLKRGTYKVKVKLSASGNANYKAAAAKKITVTIKVK